MPRKLPTYYTKLVLLFIEHPVEIGKIEKVTEKNLINLLEYILYTTRECVMSLTPLVKRL